MVVGVGLAVLCIGGLVVPRIVRCIRTKFNCSSACPGPDNPQKNTLIVTLGFWPGASDENGSGFVDKANGLTQTLAVNISKSIYNEVIRVSFFLIMLTLQGLIQKPEKYKVDTCRWLFNSTKLQRHGVWLASNGPP